MKNIQSLLQSNQTIFHASDLCLLWNITNPDSLNTTISRYVGKGILYRLHKGFYSVKPIKSLSADEIGLSALHAYGYISTETILFRAGLIHQSPQHLTLISDTSKTFTVAGHSFLSRQMKDVFLYNDMGVVTIHQRKYATTERAVADLLYYIPDYYFDAHDKIDWAQVKTIQQTVGYI